MNVHSLVAAGPYAAAPSEKKLCDLVSNFGDDNRTVVSVTRGPVARLGGHGQEEEHDREVLKCPTCKKTQQCPVPVM